ncbi:MAG: hypothetical protein II393_02320 [Cytophagales bacterium]|nr:hypothetical protein [Cytophagales bacterium]
MGFGKKQEVKKTKSEKENQQLGRQAYPSIQPAADRIGNLAMNPDEYRQTQLNTYYGPNTATWSDAMRNYQRRMGDVTANNYAATHGGYTSAGQKLYDDTQRYQNDLAARLYDKGVQSVNNMLNQDTNLAQNYYKDMLYQHNLAAQPDSIDAYNEAVRKANSNRWTGILDNLGSAVENYAPGYWKAIGTGMRLGANAGSTDTSDVLALRGGQIGLSGKPSDYANSVTDLGAIMSSGAKNWSNWGGLQGINTGRKYSTIGEASEAWKQGKISRQEYEDIVKQLGYNP